MVSSAAPPDAKRATPLRSSSATLKPPPTTLHPTDTASLPAPRRATSQRSDALSLPEAKRRGEVVSLPPREKRAARSEAPTDGIVATPPASPRLNDPTYVWPQALQMPKEFFSTVIA